MTNGTLSYEAGKNLFDQIMSIYILPYIQEKQEKGLFPKPFSIKAAQIITDPAKKSPEIRVNNQVKWIAKVKLKDGITKNEGDIVTSDEIEGIDKGELLDEEKNFSHITMFIVGNKWLITFNFISNILESQRLLSISKEYLRAAKDSHERRDKYATVGILFHACELAARASMLSFPTVGIATRGEIRSHGEVNKRYIGFSRLFVVHREGSTVLNKLMTLRDDARYGVNDLIVNHDTISKYIESVEMLVKSQDRYH